MAYSYNMDEVTLSNAPSLSHELRKAKEYLQKHNPESGDCLYDHLSDLLNKILSERPKNALDVFEEYSKKLKEDKFKSQTDHLQDVYVPPLQYENAKNLIKLFEELRLQKEEEKELIQEEEETDYKEEKENLLDLLYFIEQAGIGLPRSEISILNLSIEKLIKEAPIRNVRFWGKILGNPKNYYILEVDLKKDELIRRQQEIAVQEKAREKENGDSNEAIKKSEEETAANTQKEAIEKEALDAALKTQLPSERNPVEKGLELIFPALPQNLWKPPVQIPPEQIGTGLNRKVYFVCNSPGLDNWIELPVVTPQQIIASRSIVKIFTGNLKTELFTFPSFPGNEANYLRTQIARISATALISPVGYFKVVGEVENEEEEEEEEETTDQMIIENPYYDPLSIKDLTDPSLSNWCHHSPFILNQGRVVPWNSKETEVDDDEIDDEDEEEEEEDEDVENDEEIVEKEIGPPLLTPLSEDAIFGSVVPWSVRQSFRTQKDASIAIVRSNLWPGAFAFASKKRLVNLYIGNGNKYYPQNYTPPPMPEIQNQYEIGPEVMEITDPSIKEEEAYRKAHLPVQISEILENDNEEDEDVSIDEGDNEDNEDDDENDDDNNTVDDEEDN